MEFDISFVVMEGPIVLVYIIFFFFFFFYLYSHNA